MSTHSPGSPDRDTEALVVDIDGEVMEPEIENVDHGLASSGLYGEGKLVKRWRLTGKQNVRSQDYPDGSGSVAAGIYLEPDSGMFYGRVPENNEGALYVEDSLSKMRRALDTALKSHVGMSLPVDTRIWERIIRISYPQVRKDPPDWRTGRPSGGGYGSGHLNAGHVLVRDFHEHGARGVPESDTMGPLGFTRIERALRPDGLYDVREWEEDYQTRLSHFENRRDKSDRSKPGRYEAKESDPSSSRFTYSRDARTRNLPWSPELWQALRDFQDKIRQMDGVIRQFVLETEVSELERSLITGSGVPLLTGPESS